MLGVRGEPLDAGEALVHRPLQALEAPPQELHAVADVLHGRVDLVGDARGELPHRLELLPQPVLRLHSLVRLVLPPRVALGQPARGQRQGQAADLARVEGGSHHHHAVALGEARLWEVVDPEEDL